MLTNIVKGEGHSANLFARMFEPPPIFFKYRIIYIIDCISVQLNAGDIFTACSNRLFAAIPVNNAY